MSEEQMLSFKKNIPSYNERKSYVKTIVCDVLGYDENNMYNQLVGDFYDNYLREHFTSIAIEEYQISPMIEIMLSKMNGEEQKVIGNNIFIYIQNVVANYSNGDLASATLMFIYMNDYLRKIMNNVGILAIDKHNAELKDKVQENILKKVINY